jgi:ATP-dependent helicase STH1/SNF2
MGVLRQLNMQKPSLSNDQLATLIHQIWAYKLLSVNKPIPNQLQGLLFGDSSSPNNSRPQTAGSPVPPSSPNQMKESTETSPYRVLPSSISYTQHGERSNRPIIPAILPTPINPYSALATRENYIQSRVQYRIQELEAIPSNISNEYFHGSGEEGNLKIKLLIELKALKLLEKQKLLREELLTGVSKGTMLATAIDRSSYRRMKRQTLREARQTEKLERNQRQEKEKKEKQKQIDFLNGIVNHGRELLNFHRQYQGKFSKLGQAVVKFHGNAEKEEQKRLQKNAQDRIRALRADDEEAYLKLIDQAKDTRITQILQQTNSYLSNLTSAVLNQKRAVASGEADMDTSEDAEESIQKDYYNTAHKVKEVIEEQPSILVGGKLKDYQIKGLQWMVSLYNNRLNGILADEMGLGKTIQTISLICYLIEKKKQNGPFLVIVPLSTISNWSLEFDKWAPSVAKIVFKGSPNERKRASYEIRQGNFNVLLTTYEYIIKERPLLSKIKWIHMIIDEGHRMKNNQSKLSQTLSQYYSSRYRLILTGTPLQVCLFRQVMKNFCVSSDFMMIKAL